MNQQTKKMRSTESGNVLFLILIAVALFAALSYAVTQSTRSGAGDAQGETNLISSAALTQYPAGVRTSVVRMIIGGVAVEDLLFNSPSTFAADIDGDNEEHAVFHPRGGNASYQLPPRDIMVETTPANPDHIWHFNAEAQIQNIGLTDDTDPTGNDIIAWLPGLKAGVCRRVNQELGITGAIPAVTVNNSVYTTDMLATPAYTISTPGIVIGEDAASGEVFSGQPFGCFVANGENVYYHVLIER